jgi:hypothetical protein
MRKVTASTYVEEFEINTVLNSFLMLKLKLNLSHYTPWRSLGERMYSSYSFSVSAVDGSSQSYAQAALSPRGKDPTYPLDRRLGGPQSWSGHRG